MLKGHLLRWQPVQRLRQLGQFHSCACDLAANGSVQASKAEKLLPAAPGTVKEYQQHILIQTAPLSSDSSAKELHSNHGCWWPSVVEKHPAVIEAVAAAAISQGNIKVTTYEESTRDTFLEAGRPVCDLRIYPAGVQYLDLPINKVRQVTAAHMDTSLPDDDGDDGEAENSLQLEAVQHLQQPLNGLHLYVCCHGSRDTRCGKLGRGLVNTLDSLIQKQQLQSVVQVLKCSHVGGHKYAGNVLVYGAMSPCDGDWFGGVNDSNAAEFLSGVLDAEVGSEGGAEESALRHLWRGRMGTSKQEQLDLYMGRTASDEDFSDADDVQNSGREAFQAAQSSYIDAKHTYPNGAYAVPQGFSCACQSTDTIHTSTARMPDAFARDHTSATVDMRAESTDADISSSDANIGSSNADNRSSDADSSSSDADTSSSSGSDSGFESSDDDPESVPPVQI